MKTDRAIARERLMKRVIPIYRVVDERVYVIGSGFFFTRDDEYYLVSAAHALRELLADPSNAGVPTSAKPGERNDVWCLGSGTASLTADDEYDVGVIRLDASVVKKWLPRGPWEVLNDQDVEHGQVNSAVVFGWPLEGIKVKEEVVPGHGPTIHAPYVLFECNHMAPPDKLPDNAKPRNVADIFLTYPEDVPDLHGVSGAPIWVKREYGELLVYPAPIFRIFGVETNVLEGGYIRGTKWFIVDKLIAEFECSKWLDRLSEQELASFDAMECPLWGELAKKARGQPQVSLQKMLVQARERRRP